MLDINTIHNVFIAIVIPPDRALFIIFFKNPFLILLLLCSNAKKNEGIPIVRPLIRVNCIGTNGYGFIIIKNNTDSINEYIVFTRNNDALFSILLITLLPSFTTLGIDLKFESVSTS